MPLTVARYAPMYQWGKALALPDFPFKAVRVSEGTHPTGSHWTRNPVPAWWKSRKFPTLLRHFVSRELTN